MPASQMTSLRIPEDHLMLLDQRVGFDGMRNRSDVIRAAVQHYLDATPSHALVKTVKFQIGTETQDALGKLYELRGISPSEAARAGLAGRGEGGGGDEGQGARVPPPSGAA